MRIAIFSDNFYPELSGISDSIIALAQELVRRGHQITFSVPRYSKADYEVANLAPHEIDLGSKVTVSRYFSFHYPTPTKQGRAVVPTGLRWIGLRKFDPDLIHTQLFFGVGLEALAACHFLKKPIIGTNHTAIKEFMKYSPIEKPWLTEAVLKYVNWYYGKCDLVTAPARWLIDEMEKEGFKKEFRILPNPLDTKTFEPSPDRVRLKEKWGFGKHVVVHAGRLSPERKVDTIIRAVAIAKKDISDLELAIAGRGVAEIPLQDLARELHIASSVKWLGILDKPSLAEVYNASEIFMLTSVSDIQSTVMMQAMATGLPVIATRAGGNPEYVSDKNGFLIPVDRADLAAEKITALMKDEALRKQLADGAFEFTRAFSGGEIANEWEELYRETIEKYHT